MRVSHRSACSASATIVTIGYVLLCGCGGGGSSATGPPVTVPTTNITVNIYPSAPVSLNSGQTQQFAASISGTSDINLIWNCSPGNTISQSGLFTATAAVTITATSHADSTKSASATVTVTNPDANSILAEDSGGIVIMNPDGSGRRTLVSQGSAPRWTADHWHLAYHYQNAAYPYQISLMLTIPDGTDSSSVWSAAGCSYSTFPESCDATISPDRLRVAYINSIPYEPGTEYLLKATNLSEDSTFNSPLPIATLCAL